MSRTFKSLLFIALLLGLCGAAVALISAFADLDLTTLWRNPALLPALATQLLVALLMVLVWRVLLHSQLRHPASWFDAGAQVGMTLLGKYIPGKIWGMVGRAMILNRRGVSLGATTQVLVLEQVLTLSSGIAVSGVLLGFLWFPNLGLLFLAAALLALPLLVALYSRITGPLLRLTTRALARQFAIAQTAELPTLNRTGFYQAFAGYTVYWLSSGIALALLVYPYLADDWFRHAVLVTAVLPTAVLAAFFALWAPGGIGVREGIVVGLLSLQLPLEVAALIAVVFRLVCIITDLVIGTLALAYFARHPEPAVGETRPLEQS